MQMQEIVADQLRQTVSVLSDVAKDTQLHDVLVSATRETAKSLKKGHKLMVAGIGGSAADAQHLLAKFVSRLMKDRAGPSRHRADYGLINFDCARK